MAINQQHSPVMKPTVLEEKDAAILNELAWRMLRAKRFNTSVRAIVDFFVAATKLNRLDDLNHLGELFPKTVLSERSLDRVFEDGQVSDAAVEVMLHTLEIDQEFKAKLFDQWGATCTESWVRASRDMFSGPQPPRIRPIIKLNLEPAETEAVGF